MTYDEAVKYMENGGKVRRPAQKEGYFAIKPDPNGYIYMVREIDAQYYERSYPRFDDNETSVTDWETYK